HRWPTAARRPDLLRRTHRTVQVCPLPNGRTGALRPPPRPPRARQHRHAPVGVADRGPSETAARSAVSAKTTWVHSAHHSDAARLEIARRRVVKRCRPRPRQGSALVGSAQVIAAATELSGSLGLASFVTLCRRDTSTVSTAVLARASAATHMFRACYPAGEAITPAISHPVDFVTGLQFVAQRIGRI